MSDFKDDALIDNDTTAIVVDQKETEHAIATVNKQLDGAITIKDNINKIKVIVEDSIDDNAVNPTAAHLLSMAIESLDRPIREDKDYLQVKVVDIPFPSLENFEYRRERQISTKISLESINNKWRSFWLWLSEKIKKIVTYLVQFYKQRTFFINRLIERIERLERYIKEASLKTNERFLSNANLARGLSINGRAPFNLREHVKQFNIVSAELLNTDKNVKISSLVNSLKLYANNPTINIKNALINTLSPDSYLLNKTDIEKTCLSKYVSTDLFGNRHLVYYVINNAQEWSIEQIAKDIGRVGGSLEYVEPKLSFTDKLPILSISDLQYIVIKIRDTMSDVKKYIVDLKQLFGTLNDLSLFTSTLANRKQLEGRENKIRDKLIHDLAIRIPRIVQQPMYSYTNYASDICRQLTYYVELCVGYR